MEVGGREGNKVGSSAYLCECMQDRRKGKNCAKESHPFI